MTESLYRKKNGEFFLYAVGGPNTKYGLLTKDNQWIQGERIIPIESKSAEEWAKKNLPSATIERFFGDGSDEVVHITFRIPKSLKRDFEAKCKANGTTMSKEIVNYINRYIIK